jgi:Sporulation and spore germination.
MKKIVAIYMILLVILTGCQEVNTATEPYIYYLNVNGMDVMPVAYSGDLSYGKSAVLEMIEAMQNPGETMGGNSPFIKGVQVEEVILEGTALSLHFSREYKDLSVVEEVLLRASVAQSVLKIAGLETVTFYVEDALLEDAKGVAYGAISAEDFVQNVGSAINSYQTEELSLYFADESGARLKKETKSVRYNSNTSMEKVVVARVMQGTTQNHLQSTVAKATKLLGVTVKEDICYVNFDDGIQEVVANITPEVLLYSIVNSLVENGIASQVQISINGESTGKLLGSISLEKPFEANWELVRK